MSEPTIVLVHGAFADATGSWDGVTRILLDRGHRVITVANPLRGLHHDAEYVRTMLATTPGPIVLVGHSYGGAVITQAATEAENVSALVYVAAFAPDQDESAGELDQRFGGVAQQVTTARPLPGAGQTDLDGPPQIELSIDPARFHEVFAPDTTAANAAVLAANQRPLALAAMLERVAAPAWKRHPGHYVIATEDQMIPVAGQRFMAERMNANVVEVPTGHLAMLGAPETIAHFITTATEH